MNSRIKSIDVLRGCALLGILIMNMMSFAMPSIAYFSPVAYEASITNQILYGIGHVIADQKFMAIFSMLFGASTLLFIQSAVRKGKKAALLFYSRNFWLLIIGWVHSYFIWYGDVLLVYALCALVLYFCRSISPRKQFVAGIIIYLLPTIGNCITYGYTIDRLTPAEQQVFVEKWEPPPMAIEQELAVYRGAYAEQLAYRASMWEDKDAKSTKTAGVEVKGLLFLGDVFARAFGMMLIGMACFTWGIFSNTREISLYKKMMRIGLGVGVPLSIIGLVLSYSFDWHWKYAHFLGRIPNTIATPFTAFGYVALIMLWTRSEFAKALQDKLSAVGKTALTAYLLQSLVATFIFYGFGLGLFGYVNRIGQFAIIFLMWWGLLVFCPAWVNRFLYGPCEWAWRSATYMKIVPIRKKN